ncbi:Protein tyrosine kinase [Leishmania braziliensis]|nr:Protein tyrosine kinase [Leishmania braziliensis]
MQVDIGNNTVRQNFSSIVSSEEIRQLNDRLYQEYAGGTSGQATAASHQESRDLGFRESQRRAYPDAAEGAARVPSHHEAVFRSPRPSSLGSRHSHPQHAVRQHGSTSHSRPVRPQSPEGIVLPSRQGVVGVSQIHPVPWIAIPGSRGTPIYNVSASSGGNSSAITQGVNNYTVQPQYAKPPSPQQQQSPEVFRRARPSSAPMAAVTSPQRRQQGLPDAAHNGDGGGCVPEALDGAHKHAGDNPSKGMIEKEPDRNRRDHEGSGNSKDKPAALAVPKLAQTKIQIGMRLRRWIVINRIGAGSFGETFTAIEVDGTAEEEDSLTVTSENLKLVDNLPPLGERNEVCIKVEQANKNVLRLEALALKKVQSCTQVVRYLGSGCTNGMNFLVMEKLGSNLAELRRRSQHGTFNIYTTLKAGVSCLTAIRGVHDLGLVHRDIKPSNFVTGLPGTSHHTTCYLIDFGLARRFRRSNGEIRPPRENAGFRGTSRYASVASHHHQELGRVDDLWSLLFMLVEFATGTLPWRKYKEKDDIGRCKEESISPHLVRNLPREFQPFLAHLQTLRYEDEPDYDLLLTLMYRALERRGYPANKPVEWEIDPSIADSGIDAGGAAVIDIAASVPHGPVARPQDASPAHDVVGNGHLVEGGASGRPPHVGPHRTAPQPGDVEIASQEAVNTPLPSGLANGATACKYPAEAVHLHNSGTIRVSEVDVGVSGAGQDSVHVNAALSVDASMQNQRQLPQGGTPDIRCCIGALAIDSSDTPRPPLSSVEYNPKDYSPFENGLELHNRPPAPVSHSHNAAAPNANRAIDGSAAGPSANSALQSKFFRQRREETDNHNGLKLHTNYELHANDRDPLEGNKRGSVLPSIRMGGRTTDLDADLECNEQGKTQKGKESRWTPKKKSRCECVVM